MNTNHELIGSTAWNGTTDRKPRIDDGRGPSPLQRLKMLSRDAHDRLLQQRSEMSFRQLIGEIESRHGIAGLVPPRLTEFFTWLSERRMKEVAAAFREKLVADHATLEDAHNAALSSLLLEAVREDNRAFLRFVLREVRRARTLGLSVERLKIMEYQAMLARHGSEKTPPAPDLGRAGKTDSHHTCILGPESLK